MSHALADSEIWQWATLCREIEYLLGESWLSPKQLHDRVHARQSMPDLPCLLRLLHLQWFHHIAMSPVSGMSSLVAGLLCFSTCKCFAQSAAMSKPLRHVPALGLEQ